MRSDFVVCFGRLCLIHCFVQRWSDEVHKLERFNDQNIARFLGVVEEKGHWALVQVSLLCDFCSFFF